MGNLDLAQFGLALAPRGINNTWGTRELVRRTLRGPRATEAELLAAAERLGFRPDEADDR